MHGVPICPGACRRRSTSRAVMEHNNPHLFSTGTNLVVALDDMLVVKIFPPLLRHQFTSERMLRGPPPAVLGSLNRLKDWNNARQFA